MYSRFSQPKNAITKDGVHLHIGEWYFAKKIIYGAMSCYHGEKEIPRESRFKMTAKSRHAALGVRTKTWENIAGFVNN